MSCPKYMLKLTINVLNYKQLKIVTINTIFELLVNYAVNVNI